MNVKCLLVEIFIIKKVVIVSSIEIIIVIINEDR